MWIKVSNSPPDRSSYFKHSEDYLIHYQVKGAKHGLRRYQNPDGSLTPLGRIHYGVGDPRARRQQEREYKRTERANEKAARNERVDLAKQGVTAGKARKKWENMSDEDKMKVYDKNMKVSRDIRYKKEQDEKAKKQAEENAKTTEEKAKKQAEENAKTEKKALEKEPSRREQKKAAKEEAKREEQIKKDTETMKDAVKDKNQNDSSSEPPKEHLPTSSADYKSVGKALKYTGDNLGLMKGLVDTVEGARQRNRVREAVGERKLSKPISEMSDREINETLNRWSAEERIASATVGQKSRAAERIGTALDVVGNLTYQTSNAFYIAENIRSIAERH